MLFSQKNLGIRASLGTLGITSPYAIRMDGSDTELVTFELLFTMAESEHEMADTFDKVMVYVLDCIGKSALTLKEEQRKAARYILNGKDTFVWLPTGFRKSICYECLPFAFDLTLGRMQSE